MRYEAEVIAFDMLDQVHIAVRVRSSSDRPPLTYQVEYQHTEDLQGIGESDPRHWLQRVLETALEAL